MPGFLLDVVCVLLVCGVLPLRAFACAFSHSFPSPLLLAQPLSTDNNSTWRAFFDNQRIIEEIRKDIRRTCPDLHFFVAEGPLSPSPSPPPPRRTRSGPAYTLWALLCD